jgi:hypothetical protein
MTQALEHHVLKADPYGIAKSADITLESKETVEPSVSGRSQRTRIYKATLPRSVGIEAHFVREGWLERAKKHFVDEIEVGSAHFDDAIFVVTSTRSETAAFLSSVRVQQALLLLVDATRSVYAQGNVLRVVDEDAPDDGSDAKAALLALALCAIK